MTTELQNIFSKYLTTDNQSSNLAPVSEITKAAAVLGRLGGLAKSARKRAAVQANGKLGGRPLGAKDKAPRKRRLSA